MKTFNSNNIIDMNKITHHTLALILLMAVREESEEVTWSSHDPRVRLVDKPADRPFVDLLGSEGEWPGKAVALEALTQEIKSLASVGEGTPSAGQFLLQIGDHQVTVHVEETITLRLIGSKAASTAARNSLIRQLEESSGFNLLSYEDGSIIGRIPSGTPAVRSKLTATIIIFALLVATAFISLFILML